MARKEGEIDENRRELRGIEGEVCTMWLDRNRAVRDLANPSSPTVVGCSPTVAGCPGGAGLLRSPWRSDSPRLAASSSSQEASAPVPARFPPDSPPGVVASACLSGF